MNFLLKLIIYLQLRLRKTVCDHWWNRKPEISFCILLLWRAELAVVGGRRTWGRRERVVRWKFGPIQQPKVDWFLMKKILSKFLKISFNSKLWSSGCFRWKSNDRLQWVKVQRGIKDREYKINIKICIGILKNVITWFLQTNWLYQLQ